MSSTNPPKAPGLRRSNTWLHTWSGLLLGWLLYVIFFTGTLSFLRAELQHWSQPESHFVEAQQQAALPQALALLDTEAKNTERWDIQPANARQPVWQVRWRERDPETGERQRQRLLLDTQTGESIDERDTRLADFLYRMHFELYGLERNTGRWIVGVATFLMFIALISGIIIHKKIFTDFFTFRRNKALRSWLDFHNVTAVVSLPFHLMITSSGLLLIMYLLMPWGIEALYSGDHKAFRQQGGGKGGVKIELAQPADPAWSIGSSDNLAQALQKATAHAQQHWPNGVSYIRIDKPKSTEPVISLWQRGGQSLLNRASSEKWQYAAYSGELLRAEVSQDATHFFKATYNVLTALHLQRYADPIQRWVFFMAGVLGTVMVATGMIMWVIRREKKAAQTLGHRVVKTLNVAVMLGLPLATLTILLANRWLPSALPSRIDWEIALFFIAWLASFVHAVWRPYHAALKAQLIALSLLCFSLFAFDVFVLYQTLPFKQASWIEAGSVVNSIDGLVLFSGVLSLIALRVFLSPHTARPKHAKRSAREATS